MDPSFARTLEAVGHWDREGLYVPGDGWKDRAIEVGKGYVSPIYRMDGSAWCVKVKYRFDTDKDDVLQEAAVHRAFGRRYPRHAPTFLGTSLFQIHRWMQTAPHAVLRTCWMEFLAPVRTLEAFLADETTTMEAAWGVCMHCTFVLADAAMRHQFRHMDLSLENVMVRDLGGDGEDFGEYRIGALRVCVRSRFCPYFLDFARSCIRVSDAEVRDLWESEIPDSRPHEPRALPETLEGWVEELACTGVSVAWEDAVADLFDVVLAYGGPLYHKTPERRFLRTGVPFMRRWKAPQLRPRGEAAVRSIDDLYRLVINGGMLNDLDIRGGGGDADEQGEPRYDVDENGEPILGLSEAYRADVLDPAGPAHRPYHRLLFRRDPVTKARAMPPDRLASLLEAEVQMNDFIILGQMRLLLAEAKERLGDLEFFETYRGGVAYRQAFLRPFRDERRDDLPRLRRAIERAEEEIRAALRRETPIVRAERHALAAALARDE